MPNPIKKSLTPSTDKAGTLIARGKVLCVKKCFCERLEKKLRAEIRIAKKHAKELTTGELKKQTTLANYFKEAYGRSLAEIGELTEALVERSREVTRIHDRYRNKYGDP